MRIFKRKTARNDGDGTAKRRKPTAGSPVQAVWKGAVLARSDRTVVVEGNHYFPLEDVFMEFLIPVDTTTSCAWKGEASYFTVEVDGQRNAGAAWVYRDPKSAASEIAGRIAFWQGVKIETAEMPLVC